MLVTLEGVDGVGKTSVIDYLADKYPYAIFTKEPVDMQWVDNESTNNHTRLYAFLLDHAKHVNDLLRKKNNDNLIICDRYVDSRCAYQSVDLHVPISRIRKMHCDDYTITPDVTFILIAKLETITERLAKRDGERFYATDKHLTDVQNEILKNDYMRRIGDIQNKYMQIAKSETRCIVIDTTHLTPEEVAERIEITLNGSYCKKMEYIRTKVNNKKVIAESLARISRL